MLVHHLPLAVAPLEDTGATGAGPGAIGGDPVQAPRHGQVAVRLNVRWGTSKSIRPGDDPGEARKFIALGKMDP